MSEYGYGEDFIGYGVELSTQTARKSRSRPRGRRGLDRDAILDAAFDMMSRVGEVDFSVRKLGSHIGVDPMTVLHHFGSKDELLRRIADRALATVELPLPSADWRADLRKVAVAYRDLAHRHPRLFHLHFRFHATGPADHASSEVVYRALRTAGLSDAEAAGLGLAFYAFILGYALAEAEGLLRPISDEDEAELLALDPLACPATQALIPAFKALDRDAAFDASVDAFVDGVSCRCKARLPQRSARSRSPVSGPIASLDFRESGLRPDWSAVQVELCGRKGAERIFRRQKSLVCQSIQQKSLCRCKACHSVPATCRKQGFSIAAGAGVCTVVGDWAGPVESRPFITMKMLPAQGVYKPGTESNGTGKLLCRDHEIGRSGGGAHRGVGGAGLRRRPAEADAHGISRR
mgnify:CR=1 FL=1